MIRLQVQALGATPALADFPRLALSASHRSSGSIVARRYGDAFAEALEQMQDTDTRRQWSVPFCAIRTRAARMLAASDDGPNKLALACRSAF